MTHPRQGWEEKFKMMAENDDDKMIDVEFGEQTGEQTEWDEQEWEWNS